MIRLWVPARTRLSLERYVHTDPMPSKVGGHGTALFPHPEMFTHHLIMALYTKQIVKKT